MDRPFIEVTLPVSGIKAEVYSYYLRGEKKAIEAIMLESAEFEQDEAGTPRLKKVDATYRTRMEDKAVALAVKKLTDKEGKELKVEIETFDSLPAEDFTVLQNSLPGAVKKK